MMKAVVLVDACFHGETKEQQDGYFSRSQENDFLWEERDYNYSEGPKGGIWGAGKDLFIDPSGDYTAIWFLINN